MQSASYESCEQLSDLLDETDEIVTTLANASAFLNGMLRDVNWVGFYLLRGDSLYLGPFQGKPACTKIAVDKGVCGTAIAQNCTQRVRDVHLFPGHIACDSESNSELVVVLHDAAGNPIGVLDIDSPLPDRFSEQDQREMERAAQIISGKISIKR